MANVSSKTPGLFLLRPNILQRRLVIVIQMGIVGHGSGSFNEDFAKENRTSKGRGLEFKLG
jgi:hypothetical protein